jgi:C-terminal processing protease CtpA/Prc
MPTRPPAHTARRPAALLLAALLLAACAAFPTPAPAPQPPGEYLDNALNWLETHAYRREAMDWDSLRQAALALAPQPATTADTYPALHYVTGELADPVTWFAEPDEAADGAHFGLTALYPQGTVIAVDAGGPADKAGVRMGDVVEAVNGSAPTSWRGRHSPWVGLGDGTTVTLTLRRAGQSQAFTVTVEGLAGPLDQRAPAGQRLQAGTAGIGYLELTSETGERWQYATLAQQALRAADQPAACGWIVDARRLAGGNIWSYLAAIGPVLGEGEVGGFAYPGGGQEAWTYREGKVYWHEEERDESIVEGPRFRPARAGAPVALLTGPATIAAGELLVVAFQGRPDTRRFGEATGGAPFLQFHTTLSDGAWLTVSGAAALDRAGQVYAGPIAPDEAVATDWTAFGGEQDPVVRAALDWLRGTPACAG